MTYSQSIEPSWSHAYLSGSKVIFPSDRNQGFREEALRIFSNYALSPEDFSNAVAGFIRMSADCDSLPSDRKLSEREIVNRVLLSLKCEDVWRRDA